MTKFIVMKKSFYPFQLRC